MGWDSGGTGLNSDFTLNPALVGVVLVITHKDFPQAGLLQAALRSALGIEIRAEIDDAKKVATENDVIHIAVGAKPPTASSTH
jgi:hypothetical protein